MIVYNNLLPLPGYRAMAFWPFIFVRKKFKGDPRNEKMFRHERIHFAQQKELGFLPFYVLWLYYFVRHRAWRSLFRYRSIPFEREAYAHQNDENYLATRKHYAQWRSA